MTIVPSLRRILCPLVACVALAAESAPLGDRLVLSVNNVPYTQRQVETYITLKESLRKTNDGSVRLVVAANWSDALTVFAEDMVILQESQRLGSFQAADQMLDKYLGVIKEKLAKGRELQDAVRRLGVDEPTMGRTLDAVLRVAAFRRGKERQDQTLRRSGEEGDTAARGKWLDDLESRAIVRRYDDAEKYQVLQPTLGRQSDAR